MDLESIQISETGLVIEQNQNQFSSKTKQKNVKDQPTTPKRTRAKKILSNEQQNDENTKDQSTTPEKSRKIKKRKAEFTKQKQNDDDQQYHVIVAKESPKIIPKSKLIHISPDNTPKHDQNSSSKELKRANSSKILIEKKNTNTITPKEPSFASLGDFPQNLNELPKESSKTRFSTISSSSTLVKQRSGTINTILPLKKDDSSKTSKLFRLFPSKQQNGNETQSNGDNNNNNNNKNDCPVMVRTATTRARRKSEISSSSPAVTSQGSFSIITEGLYDEVSRGTEFGTRIKFRTPSVAVDIPSTAFRRFRPMFDDLNSKTLSKGNLVISQQF